MESVSSEGNEGDGFETQKVYGGSGGLRRIDFDITAKNGHIPMTALSRLALCSLNLMNEAPL